MKPATTEQDPLEKVRRAIERKHAEQLAKIEYVRALVEVQQRAILAAIAAVRAEAKR